MKIAGRVAEISLLKNLLENQESEFVAVYGRRRIGKTFLIRQVYSSHIVFESVGLHQSNMRRQLETFNESLKEVIKSDKSWPPPKTWTEAFLMLKNYLSSLKSKKKKVVFLDEISWFETPRSGFLAALDHFWNHFCSRRNDIILVICGSAASWIIQKVLNNRGGLHNRVTIHLPLMPFNLIETEEFLELNRVRLTRKDISLLYMCVGGVPYYLKDVAPGKSVPQILDDLIFGPNARLKGEFANLYASLFHNHALHESVVKALASKNRGLTRVEILKETKQSSGGGVSLVIQELVQCGFVTQIPAFQKTKEDHLYRLVDEFTLFHFKFMAGGRPPANGQLLSGKPAFKIWSGLAFETVCFKHILQLKRALGVSGVVSQTHSWTLKGNQNETGTQIDLLLDRDDNCINLFEIKYYDSELEINKSYAEVLRNKMAVFKNHSGTRKNVFLTLISAYGARKNEHFLSTVSGEILLDALFINN